MWFAIRLAAASEALAAQPSPNLCTVMGGGLAGGQVTGAGKGQEGTAMPVRMTSLMGEIQLHSDPRVPRVIRPILSSGPQDVSGGVVALPQGLQV